MTVILNGLYFMKKTYACLMEYYDLEPVCEGYKFDPLPNTLR